MAEPSRTASTLPSSSDAIRLPPLLKYSVFTLYDGGSIYKKSLSMKQIGGKGRDKIFPVHMIGKANLRNFLSMEVVRNVFVVMPKDL